MIFLYNTKEVSQSATLWTAQRSLKWTTQVIQLLALMYHNKSAECKVYPSGRKPESRSIFQILYRSQGSPSKCLPNPSYSFRPAPKVAFSENLPQSRYYYIQMTGNYGKYLSESLSVNVGAGTLLKWKNNNVSEIILYLATCPQNFCQSCLHF